MNRFLSCKTRHIPAAAVWLVACFPASQSAIARQPKPRPQPPGNEFVKARLACEKTAIARSGATNIAVVFDISPGWHLYWRNPGDSGLPPRVSITPVEGVTFGEPQWPAPKRRVEGGALLDYVYEHQLVLIIPVTVAPEYAGGEKIPVSAKVEWLVCKERCVKGRKALAMNFPIAEGGKPSPDAKLFAAARTRLPQPATVDKKIEIKWHADNLTIHTQGATRLTFFPYLNPDNIMPADMVGKGTVSSDTLRLRYAVNVRTLKHVAGVLAIKRDGKETFVEINVNVPKSK